MNASIDRHGWKNPIFEDAEFVNVGPSPTKPSPAAAVLPPAESPAQDFAPQPPAASQSGPPVPAARRRAAAQPQDSSKTKRKQAPASSRSKSRKSRKRKEHVGWGVAVALLLVFIPTVLFSAATPGISVAWQIAGMGIVGALLYRIVSRAPFSTRKASGLTFWYTMSSLAMAAIRVFQTVAETVSTQPYGPGWFDEVMFRVLDGEWLSWMWPELGGAAVAYVLVMSFISRTPESKSTRG